MKIGTRIQTERLVLRHWNESAQDRRFFHFIMSNQKGRRYYPNRLNEDQANTRLKALIHRVEQDRLGWGVACLKDNSNHAGRPIGFVGLSLFRSQTHFAPCVEIGWQFDPEIWGKGYATEAARALLRHGFDDLGLDEIYAFAVPENRPSIAVMERIGMKRVKDGDFDHPDVPDSHSQLKRHVLYRASASGWN